MDWLVLAVGEAAPFLSAPAVGCLSGAAPCSWKGPCASLQGAVRMGRHSKREGAVGVNAAAPQGPAPNRSRSCGCWSSPDDLDLKPSSIAGRNSSPSLPGSLPRVLPPRVPFPRHPSCRVLGSTAQGDEQAQKEKVGIPREGCCWQRQLPCPHPAGWRGRWQGGAHIPARMLHCGAGTLHPTDGAGSEASPCSAGRCWSSSGAEGVRAAQELLLSLTSSLIAISSGRD